MFVHYFHEVIKKLYMYTIIGSSGRDCVLIILFQLYGSKAKLFDGNLLWLDQYDHPNVILKEELIQY